ncbi:FmdB family zinc ribbon protein [Methylomonas koyamae]|uniref:FmdB family zinc ribbon protein n=1 Tax=Methylomonas koyamae TaxID=702114 RepID=UPI0035C21D84
MPTYDYHCGNCGSDLEFRHSVNSNAPECPQCGGIMEKRILSAPAVHGYMAVGRNQAMASLQRPLEEASHRHGPGCGCCGGHRHATSSPASSPSAA